MSDEPWWGMPVPDEATKAYGARAIYEPRTKHLLNFLPDRVSWRGRFPNEDLRVVVNEIKRKLRERSINPSDAQILSGRAARRPDYAYTFSPRASCGYVYISIWYDPKTSNRRPRCHFCWYNSGLDNPAHFVASQESKKSEWRFICRDHREGWNEPDESQPGPIYPLGDAVY